MFHDDLYNELSKLNPRHQFGTFECLNETHRAAIAHLQELASQILASAPALLKQRSPLTLSHVVILHGGTGRGKSHLAEAFAASLLQQSPSLRKVMYLSRKHFSGDCLHGDQCYEDKRIVIIDDIFGEEDPRKNPATLSEVDEYEIGIFTKFMASLYEWPQLVVITSAFPLITSKPATGIWKRMQKVDRGGSYLSRARKVFQNTVELELVGSDYRHRQQRGNAALKQSSPRMVQLSDTNRKQLPAPPKKKGEDKTKGSAKDKKSKSD
jgi:hypothetical protein